MDSSDDRHERRRCARVRDHARWPPTDATVLILGESGTGKELVARGASTRAAAASRAVRASTARALPETLLESELFGHERAPSPAPTRRQAGLLRARRRRHALPRRDRRAAARRCRSSCCASSRSARFERVGGDEAMQVDVRVIAATNRDLERRSATGASARTSTTGSTSSRRAAAAARAPRGRAAARRALPRAPRAEGRRPGIAPRSSTC